MGRRNYLENPRWSPRAFATADGRRLPQKAGPATQSHPRATPKPTARQPIRNPEPPQGHPKATLKPPQSHPRASCKPLAWKEPARSCTRRRFLRGGSPHREPHFGAPADCVRSCGCRSGDYLGIQREARKARGSRVKGLIWIMPPGAVVPNPKSETRNPKQIQMPNAPRPRTASRVVVLVIPCLVLGVCFGLRVSDFGFPRSGWR